MTNHFALQHDFSEIVADQKIISASIGPDGEACLLLISADDERLALGRDERKGLASFPLSRSKNSYPATFIRYQRGILQQTRINTIKQAFPFTQPLGDGEILIVGARCDFRNGRPEKNATVFDRHGSALKWFTLGDGIQDVQTTRDGRIWISYFDEGIIGNYGWTNPVGASGIVCFDSSGRQLWSFQPPQNYDRIVDCYAMNVTGEEVWACYYTISQ